MTVPSASEERTWGMLCHLSALSLYVGVPLGNILGPLIIWLLKKDQSPFIDDQGKESLNFQISMTIYLLVASLSMFILIGFVLLPIVAIIDIVYTIIASVEANKGNPYRYPFTIKFLQ